MRRSTRATGRTMRASTISVLLSGWKLATLRRSRRDCEKTATSSISFVSRIALSALQKEDMRGNVSNGNFERKNEGGRRGSQHWIKEEMRRRKPERRPACRRNAGWFRSAFLSQSRTTTVSSLSFFASLSAALKSVRGTKQCLQASSGGMLRIVGLCSLRCSDYS